MISGFNINIRIGDLEVIRCPELWIESERHRPLTRMGIVLPDADRGLFKSIMTDESVQIQLGYRGKTPGSWAGTVSHLEPGSTKDQVCVSVVGPEKPLVTTKIIQSWENESPEAIIKWAITQAGMQIGRIDSPGCVFPRFVSSNITVWDLVRACENTCQKGFDIDMSRWALWVDNDGMVNWGDFDATANETPVIETGAGLILHTPSGSTLARNSVDTFLWPGLRHSMPFILNDMIRGIKGTFRVLKARHSMRNDKIRTVISYGEEYEKF